MKKLYKSLALFLLVSSFFLPFIPTIAQDEEEVPPYRIATFAPVGDWDGPIDPGWSLISLYFAPVTLQQVAFGDYNFKGGTEEDLIHEEWFPELCTDWEVEYWPEEENDLGWINTGGVKSIEWTLREDVTFHDGSSWNATAMKWNLDRYFLITGNLTGNGDMRNFDYWFPELAKTEKYWTPGWDLSEFDDTFAGYYVGPGVDYPGVNEIGGWVRNPHPYGGLDATGSPIYYAPYDRCSKLKWVEITESKESGGKVKVHWNTWNSYSGEGNFVDNFISMKAYAEHYTGSGIYGYQNSVRHYKNPTQVQHMIGTGPYKYVEDADEDGGYLVKYEDYWNKTAMEARGLFDIERVEFVNFPSSDAGGLAMNNALLSHAIDGAITGGGGVTGQMDIGAIEANPNIIHYPSAPDVYLSQIHLNSINETYWAWPWVRDIIEANNPNEEGEINGIPQALRKALSFAYDYDYIIDVALEGKAVRQGGIVGQGNLYYNASVPQAYYDLDYARELLLTTEEDTSGKVFTDYNAAQGYIPNKDLYNFSKICAERGLTASSTDSEWQAVAESSDPVWTIDFYWDPVNEEIKDEFQKTCNRLGIALTDPNGLTNRAPSRIWDIIQVYWTSQFASGSSIWSAGAWPMPMFMPDTTPEDYIEYMMRDPSEGLWRTDGAAGIATDWWPRWNFGFGYDDRMNALIDRMWMSSPDLKKKIISEMAELQQTELYPYIYSHQGQGGNAIWDCWETDLFLQERTGIMTGRWGFPGGMYSYANINYKGCPERTPAIPGYSLPITIAVSMISLLGVSYIFMKRNKLR